MSLQVCVNCVGYTWIKFLFFAVELHGCVCGDQHSDFKHLNVSMNMENKSSLLKNV